MAQPKAPEDQSLWTKLLSGVTSAVELRVVTYVGPVEIGGSFAEPTVNFPAAGSPSGETLATTINLADGDITTAIPESYWAPEKQAVRDFHQAQVAQANQIIERNVRLVIELASQLKEELKELKAREGEPDPTPPSS